MKLIETKILTKLIKSKIFKDKRGYLRDMQISYQKWKPPFDVMSFQEEMFSEDSLTNKKNS